MMKSSLPLPIPDQLDFGKTDEDVQQHYPCPCCVTHYWRSRPRLPLPV